jgi:membrane-anchored protein YejM (alkaline phosphatase superfamily)
MKILFRTGETTLAQRLRFVQLAPFFGLIVFALLGTRYLGWMPSPTTGWGWGYLLTTYPAHYWLLSFLLSLPLLLLSPVLRGAWLAAAAALLYSLAFILMFIDTQVFDQYRFHINWFVIDFLLNDPDGQVIHFPLVMWLLTLGGAALVLLATFVAMTLLQRWAARHAPGLKKWHLLFFVLLLGSHFLHAWADANLVKDVIRQARFYPLMLPTTAQSFMERHGLVDIETRNANKLEASADASGDIHYPKQPLQCTPRDPRPNILLITIDSWRADTFTADITPHMHRFAEQRGLMFNQHFSGSNSTRAGLFSMFYGIPGTYWHAFLDNGVPSPLITQLQAQDYALGIFAAARLTSPEFDRTIFSTVKDLRLGSSGATPAERDINLTEEWLAWLETHQQEAADRPFFGFLFYDAPHGYSYPADFSAPFQPAWETVNYFSLHNDFDPEPFLNRYRNAVHFDDQLIGRVLQDLEDRALLDNTWVVITGDHGQEFNDLKLNFWGHNSNFSKYQLQVPFILHAPQQQAGATAELTTHYDLLPTLLVEALGCANDPGVYSTGQNLLAADRKARDWFMAASYSSSAIVGRDQTVTIDAVGRYTLLDDRYREINDGPIPPWARDAVKQIYRFFAQ